MTNRDSTTRRIATGSFAGAGLQVFQFGSRFLLTPFVLSATGLAAYGYWALVFQVLGLFGLHRIGIPQATVTLVARYANAGRQPEIGALVRTAALATAGLMAIVGSSLFGAAPWIVEWLGVEEQLWNEAIFALRAAVIASAIALTLGGYQSVLEGLQRHARVRGIEALASAVEIALIVTLLTYGLGLRGLAVAYCVRVILPLPFYALLARRAAPDSNVLPFGWDRRALRELIVFGGSIQLSGLLSLTVATVDRASIAHLVSLPAAGAFELARKLVQMAGQLPLQVCAPMVPACALTGQRKPKDQARFLRSAVRIVTCLSLPLCGPFVYAPEAILALWVDTPPPHAALALRVLALAAFVHISTGPISANLRGRADARTELRYMLWWAFAAVTSVPLAANFAGFEGALVATALAQVSASIVLVHSSRGPAVPRTDQMFRDLARAAASTAPAALFFLGLNAGDATRWELAYELIPRLTAFATLTLATAWFCVLGPHERDALRRLARTAWVSLATFRRPATCSE